MSSALDTQQGGDHYKNLPIQPIEYAMANKLNYCQANVVKYVTRYKDKNGAEDLYKAIHNLQILLELEYGEGVEQLRREATASNPKEVSAGKEGSQSPPPPWQNLWPPATD